MLINQIPSELVCIQCTCIDINMYELNDNG